MKHLLLLAKSIGSKELAIGSDWLGNKITEEANQSSASIYRQGHDDMESPFVSRKNGKKISVYLGKIADEKIGMNPLRTTGIPRPHTTSTRLRNCGIFESVIRTSP